jgi:hypothetical protein
MSEKQEEECLGLDLLCAGSLVATPSGTRSSVGSRDCSVSAFLSGTENSEEGTDLLLPFRGGDVPSPENEQKAVSQDRVKGTGNQPTSKRRRFLELASRKTSQETNSEETGSIAPLLDEEPHLPSDCIYPPANYWGGSSNKEVYEYLTTGNIEGGRGRKAYENFCPTLHKLHQEYLCPANFQDRYYGKLYKWEIRYEIPASDPGGLGGLLSDLEASINPPGLPGSGLSLPKGASLVMSLLDEPPKKKNQELPNSSTWHTWFRIQKSHFFAGDNGLFAAREFQEGQVLGFYVGCVLYTCPNQGTARASHRFLPEQEGVAMDDCRTLSVMNKTGYPVQVNPCYGSDKTKIGSPPWLMGGHFLGDVSRLFKGDGKEMEKRQQDSLGKLSNVLIDDRGALVATRRIPRDRELCLPFDWRSRPLQKTRGPPPEEEEEEEEDPKRKAANETAGKATIH